MNQNTKSETRRIDTSLLEQIPPVLKMTMEYSSDREFIESAIREKLTKFGVVVS